MVRMLLKAGANAYVTDRCGSRPMGDALETDYADIYRVLRAYGGELGDDTIAKDHHHGFVLLELVQARGTCH